MSFSVFDVVFEDMCEELELSPEVMKNGLERVFKRLRMNTDDIIHLTPTDVLATLMETICENQVAKAREERENDSDNEYNDNDEYSDEGSDDESSSGFPTEEFNRIFSSYPFNTNGGMAGMPGMSAMSGMPGMFANGFPGMSSYSTSSSSSSVPSTNKPSYSTTWSSNGGDNVQLADETINSLLGELFTNIGVTMNKPTEYYLSNSVDMSQINDVVSRITKHCNTHFVTPRHIDQTLSTYKNYAR